MAMATHRTAVGVFHDADHARAAVRDLRLAGFTESQIGVVSRHDEAGRTTDADSVSGAASGAATGAAVGAGVAALWSLGMSFAVVPVIGPIIAAGPIAAALLSAAGGAAAGGLVGALIGTGLSADDAAYYEGEFKAGRTLVTVQAEGRYNEACDILERHGGYSREGTATAGAAQASGTTAARW